MPARLPDRPLDKDPQRIGGMFDAIARRYDLLNRTLSLGLDRRWRRRVARDLRLDGTEVLLDLCTGTGDLALEMRRSHPPAARILGADLAPAMLEVARGKARRTAATPGPAVWWLRADATCLPFPPQSVDIVTVAFGIRNVQDLAAALDEIRRVLRPGGRLAILEFGLPPGPILRRMYAWYFSRVLPRIGRVVSGHASAYTYLPASVGAFPAGDEFRVWLERAGFAHIEASRLTFGIVYVYTARRAAPA